MKRTVTQMMMFIFFSATVLAQPIPKEMPKEVAEAFTSKYPATVVKSWNNKKDTLVVKFKMDDRSHFAYYLPNGTWLRTETKYGLTHSLPAEVKNGWKNCKFKAWGVEAIKHIESANSNLYIIRVTNIPIYDAEHNEKETFDLFFDKNGEFIKKEERFWRSKDL